MKSVTFLDAQIDSHCSRSLMIKLDTKILQKKGWAVRCIFFIVSLACRKQEFTRKMELKRKKIFDNAQWQNILAIFCLCKFDDTDGWRQKKTNVFNVILIHAIRVFRKYEQRKSRQNFTISGKYIGWKSILWFRIVGGSEPGEWFKKFTELTICSLLFHRRFLGHGNPSCVIFDQNHTSAFKSKSFQSSNDGISIGRWYY